MPRLILYGILGILVLIVPDVDAYNSPVYIYTVPNGSKFGCRLCHVYGQPLPGAPDFPVNGFGRDYQSIAVPEGYQWTRDLAIRDSDNDGYTNGEELQEITGDYTVWSPRLVQGSEEWDLTAGVPGFARNPGDDDERSMPHMQFDPIQPGEYTLNVGEFLTVSLSGRATVPGRGVQFDFVGRSNDLEELRIATGSDTTVTWTPGKFQGGTHVIAIRISDGTTEIVQTIRVTVLGGEAPPLPPGPETPPEPPPVPFKELIPTFTSGTFDFDGSLIVDFADFTLFAAAFGSPSRQFDLDDSGRVGFRDFLLFAFFFGKKVNTHVYVRTPARDQIAFVPVSEGSFIKEIDGLFQQIYVSKHLIGKYEVTNRQYRLFWEQKYKILKLTPFPLNRISFETRAQQLPEHPVVGVNWDMASEYCKWVGGRLPTQLEWIVAARGTGQRPYAHGPELNPGRANCLNSGDPFESGPGTTPVGFYDGRLYQGFQTRDSFSLYGAYDMTGNVWEWCAELQESTDSRQTLIVGGGYLNEALSEALKIDAWEWLSASHSRRPDVGFRCLKEQ